MNSQTARSLTLEQTYPCPLCRHGQIQAMVLAEALACNFCSHIFSIEAQPPSITVVDSSQPITWLWTGQRWKLKNVRSTELTGIVWSAATLLIILPTALVALLGYLFPPLEGTSDLPFAWVWASLTLVTHGILVGWLLAEYYQIPLIIRVRLNLGRRRLGSAFHR